MDGSTTLVNACHPNKYYFHIAIIIGHIKFTDLFLNHPGEPIDLMTLFTVR